MNKLIYYYDPKRTAFENEEEWKVWCYVLSAWSKRIKLFVKGADTSDTKCINAYCPMARCNVSMSVATCHQLATDIVGAVIICHSHFHFPLACMTK